MQVFDGVYDRLMTGIPARLTVVTIGARDLPALRRFYGGLGWTELPASDDGWTGYLLGGVLLALYPLEELAAEAGATAGTGFSGITLAVNVDSPAEVDTAFAEAVAAGATVIAAPVDRSWGGRSGYVADPEGNRWEIAHAPGAVVNAAGALLSFG
jgi:catechol 2,3-dioxygenase-like lactoylglutathione lyase family enzyme